MKSIRILFLSILAITAYMLTSCSEDLGFGQEIYNQESANELLQEAKTLINNQNGIVPLPVNGGVAVQSRSGMSVITEGTPLWDYVKYYNIDGMQVLMIELQTAEKVYSRITSTRDGVTETQENETFSRLVIRKKADKLYAHVLTYMPEVNYASANKEKLDTIGYYPKYVDFTGITLTSHLDGSVFRGIRYENGKVAGIITKGSHTECDHDHGSCNHNHEIEHTTPININLFTQSLQQPQSRAGGKCQNCGDLILNGKCQGCGDGYWEECPICKQETVVDGYCTNCTYSENFFCEKCNNDITECECNEEKCPTCGEIQCSCPNFGLDLEDMCPYCSRLKELCSCYNSGNEGDSGGGGTPVTPIPPSTNENEPVLYSEVINSNAVFAMSELSLFMKIQDGMASLTAIMTYLDNDIYGGVRDVSYFDSHYSSVYNGSSISIGVRSSDAQDFISDFFQITSFDTYQFAINNRHLVISSYPGSNTTYPHYVLVVGIESDGDVVYIDPYDGEAYLLSETRFADCQKFVIFGPKQN